ncbi:S8 family serine peptidase [Candidatus Riflebacteria bacterium]
MKKVILSCIIFVLLVSNSFAGDKIPVLVIDSGTDFTHSKLKAIADPDLKELNGKKGKDDSGNGYIDDIYGWNFPENNNILVHLENAPPRYNDVIKFMELIGIYQQVGKDGMDPEDFKVLVKLYNDKKLSPWINFFGGWAHGTHCAGIVAENNDSIKMKAVAHIPVGTPPAAQVAEQLQKFNFEILQNFNFIGLASEKKSRALEDNPIYPQLIDYFKRMGKESAQKIKREADFVASLKPRVVNCSFGSPNKQLLKVFKDNMVNNWGYKNPTDEDVQNLVNLYITHGQIPRDKVFYGGLKKALIVIACGNSSEDNDKLMISPNNAPFTNTLVVAATNANKSLANFSCYGKKNVDIAVPGVNILSSTPKGKMAIMSGTSMAAPLAARYASLVFAANNELTPENVKKILMQTVDKKSWLSEKVKSGGVINIERAILAAKLVQAGKSITEAIDKALKMVQTIEVLDMPAPEFKTDFEKKLYNSAIF